MRPNKVPVRYTSHGVTDHESALYLIALGEGIDDHLSAVEDARRRHDS